MPAIRQTFVNCICIKVSAEGLQTNDFKVLKLKETAVENGQYLKIYPQGVLNVCVLI